MLSSCVKKSFQAEDCSVYLNNVGFTKSLNNCLSSTFVEDKGRLSIKSGPKTDFFNEPDGKVKYSNAPMLLSRINNSRPFTFSVKITPRFVTTYDAGALYIFIDNDRWHKFAFEMDERGMTRIVTVRTIMTSDDNNHDAVDARSVWLKISSDTKSIGFYFSTDSLTWQLARLYKNSYQPAIWIGISSQSPLGNGTTTTFEECHLTRECVSDFRKGI
jgi:hypothetical protein